MIYTLMIHLLCVMRGRMFMFSYMNNKIIRNYFMFYEFIIMINKLIQDHELRLLKNSLYSKMLLLVSCKCFHSISWLNIMYDTFKIIVIIYGLTIFYCQLSNPVASIVNTKILIIQVDIHTWEKSCQCSLCDKTLMPFICSKCGFIKIYSNLSPQFSECDSTTKLCISLVWYLLKTMSPASG